MGEGAEGYEGVVGGAASEDFGAGVADVRVACMCSDQPRIRLYFPSCVSLGLCSKQTFTSFQSRDL